MLEAEVALIPDLKLQLADKDTTIATLTKRLNLNSGNSNTPPSTDTTKFKQSRRKKTGEKQGGQKDH